VHSTLALNVDQKTGGAVEPTVSTGSVRPVVNYSLHIVDKDDIPAEIHKHRFYELCDRYADYCSIYTDGSKVGNRVASAIVYKGISKSIQLPDLTIIFRAELYALFLAIDVIRRSKLKKLVIFSDSLCSLQAIDGFNIDNDLVQKFIKEYSVQTKQGKTIALCWIPSNVSIPGYEKADFAAKGGLSLSVTALKSPASELLPRVRKLISEKNGKNRGTTVPAINFNQLIQPLVFISTSDLYHVVML